MTFYENIRAFPKISIETPVFDHLNYRLFERIPAVPGTSNNRGLTVAVNFNDVIRIVHCTLNIESVQTFTSLTFEWTL